MIPCAVSKLKRCRIFFFSQHFILFNWFYFIHDHFIVLLIVSRYTFLYFWSFQVTQRIHQNNDSALSGIVVLYYFSLFHRHWWRFQLKQCINQHGHPVLTGILILLHFTVFRCHLGYFQITRFIFQHGYFALFIIVAWYCLIFLWWDVYRFLYDLFHMSPWLLHSALNSVVALYSFFLKTLLLISNSRSYTNMTLVCCV